MFSTSSKWSRQRSLLWLAIFTYVHNKMKIRALAAAPHEYQEERDFEGRNTQHLLWFYCIVYYV